MLSTVCIVFYGSDLVLEVDCGKNREERCGQQQERQLDPLRSSRPPECAAFLSAGAYVQRLRKNESFLSGQNRFHLAVSRLRSRSNAVAERRRGRGGGRRRMTARAKGRDQLLTLKLSCSLGLSRIPDSEIQESSLAKYILPLFPPSLPR